MLPALISRVTANPLNSRGTHSAFRNLQSAFASPAPPGGPPRILARFSARKAIYTLETTRGHIREHSALGSHCRGPNSLCAQTEEPMATSHTNPKRMRGTASSAQLPLPRAQLPFPTAQLPFPTAQLPVPNTRLPLNFSANFVDTLPQLPARLSLTISPKT